MYSRTSCKLKKKHVTNPPADWVRADGVYAGIVEPELFLKAQEIILARSRKSTPMTRMLEHLRAVLLKRRAGISGVLIDEMDGLPSSTAFSHRFGTLVNAYRLIGYDPGIDFSFIEITGGCANTTRKWWRQSSGKSRPWARSGLDQEPNCWT